MRTQQEILNRIEQLKDEDFFGFETGDLIMALDYGNAKPYLKPDCTEAQWTDGREPYTQENCRKNIRNYLPFAKEKADNERGISASRSQSHFRAWMWLACDDEVLARVEATEYESYGRPKLAIIEAHYGPAGTGCE